MKKTEVCPIFLSPDDINTIRAYLEASAHHAMGNEASFRALGSIERLQRFIAENHIARSASVPIMPDYTADELAAFLETVPYKALAAELARRNSSRRRVNSGGRPKILKPCPKCGALLGARERARHHC